MTNYPRFLFILLLIIFQGVHAEQVFIDHKGIKLNAHLEMAEGKSYDDGIVLILHGFLAHNKMEIIETAQQALLDNGYSSLAINLSLGIDNRQGFHGCDNPHRHIQDDAVTEIAEWVAWLRAKGVSRITLIGHSSGANQAMVYAVENLDSGVRRLVLLAWGMSGSDYSQRRYEERYNVNFNQFTASLEKEVAQGNGDVLRKIDWNSCPQADTTPRSFLSYYSDNNRFSSFKANASRITIPVLAIIGSQDELQPNKSEILSSVNENKLIRVTTIEGADHFFRDFNIDEAMEAVIEFISDT